MTSTPTPPTTTTTPPGSGSNPSSTYGSEFGATPAGVATAMGTGTGTGMGMDMNSGVGYMVTDSGSGSNAGSGEAMLADGSYMAGLAMGGSPSLVLSSSLQSALVYIFCFLLILSF